MKLWYDDAPTPGKIAQDIAGLLIRAAVVMTLIYWGVCVVLALSK